MARTAITPTVLGGSNIADPAGTTIDATLVTNGVVINLADPSRTVLRVTNTAAGAKNLIVKAGDTQGPAWMSTQGDTTVAVGASATRWVGPLNEARYTQHGSKLNIDFESGFTGTITVFQMARGI